MPDDSLVSFEDLPAGWTFRAGTRERVNYARARRLFLAAIRGTKCKMLLGAVAIRVTRDIGSKYYWHVSDHFCVEVIDEAIDRANKKTVINVTGYGGQFVSAGKANLGFRLLA